MPSTVSNEVHRLFQDTGKFNELGRKSDSAGTKMVFECSRGRMVKILLDKCTNSASPLSRPRVPVHPTYDRSLSLPGHAGFLRAKLCALHRSVQVRSCTAITLEATIRFSLLVSCQPSPTLFYCVLPKPRFGQRSQKELARVVSPGSM